MVQETKGVNINRSIRGSKVLLINEEGQNVGVVPFHDALSNASNIGLDLVEVGNKDNIPICKIIDYGKYKYEQEKKKKKSAPKQLVKEIKLRPNTSDHDLTYRAKHVDEFLNDGHRVKIIVKFKGREQEHMFHTGKDLLERFLDKITTKFNIFSNANAEGNSILMMLEGVK